MRLSIKMLNSETKNKNAFMLKMFVIQLIPVLWKSYEIRLIRAESTQNSLIQADSRKTQQNHPKSA